LPYVNSLCFSAQPCRKFYECLDGKSIGQRQIERGGQQFLEVAYGWRDLNALLRS